MTVDVNKLRCRFVHEILKYVNCTKYSIDCCIDTAAKAWLDYKLAAFTDCTIPADLACLLSELKLTDYTVDCDTVTSVLDCDTQISLALSKAVSTCTITNELSNPVDNSKFLHFTVENDSSYPVGKINIVTTSSCGETESHTIESGNYFDINGDPVYDIEYNPHVRVSLQIPNVLTSTTGYLQKLWIYHTINSATLSSAVSIDLDPNTTPYLGSVNPAELLFGHPSYTSALQELIRNAVETIYGDADLGEFLVEVQGTNYVISSLAKHNPISTWVGLSKLNSYAQYTLTGSSSLFTHSGNCGLTEYRPFMQVAYNSPLLPCTTLPLTVFATADMLINWNATDMHQIVLASPNSISTAVFQSQTTASCPRTTLTATITTGAAVASQEWRDPTNVFESDELIIIPESSGTYTFNIELENGCSASSTILA